MTQDINHEYYLKKVLANSIGSLNYLNKANEKDKKFSSAYYDDLKKQLMLNYENKTLDSLSNAKIFNTTFGDTIKITNTDYIDFSLKDNDFKNQMNQNLKLLPKIGLKTEENLKNKGYNTIESLKNHDKYVDVASKFLKKVEKMSFLEIINLLDNNKYSKKCRDNIIKCISLIDCENFKFMDIETLGLSNVPIILIGVAEIKKDKIISSQYFLRDIYEEPCVIEGYLSHLDENSVHVTFNGKRFDIPFIKNRCIYNRINNNLDLAHIDLLYFAKNIWQNKLSNCKLQTIERELFGIERADDVPGQYIPDFYRTYLNEGNIGPIVPIIEHNRQDIISLACFLKKMYEDVN